VRLCLGEVRYVPYYQTSAVHARAMGNDEEAVSRIAISLLLNNDEVGGISQPQPDVLLLTVYTQPQHKTSKEASTQ
jgi:hypothetical protein